MKSSQKVIVGVDTGGTFTDFIVMQNGTLKHHKVASTPTNPSKAILQGLRDLGLKTQAFHLIHGSTVATNAFLERKGARIALVTTKGFEDIIEIGRQNRGDLYNLDQVPKAVLVPSSRRFGVSERLDYQGKILKSLQKTEILRLKKKIKNLSIDSIAICLLFSYITPRHEKLLKQSLKNLGLPLSLSSEILPEFREFERCASTVLNAYLSPVMNSYLEKLKMRSYARSIQIMQSNGGVISIKTAQKESIRTLLSGPAGGVVGAYQTAKQAGFNQIITFDMGGTSTDVCLIQKEIRTSPSTELEGIPIRIPMMPIHTIGAGGGSIAWIDNGGALQVGPQSAGANPGPICYGRGKQITVTDAHLFLGRLHEGAFLGGGMSLKTKNLYPAFSKMAKKLHLTSAQIATGIIKIANTHMENAIRVISTQKGRDPRDFTLTPFGGAGSLHACEMARNLGIRRILIPRNPGTLSALGMVLSPITKDYSHSVLVKEKIAKTKAAPFLMKIKKYFKPLYARAMKEMSQEGLDQNQISFSPFVDVRFEGQSFEMEVPYSAQFQKDFLKKHHELYGMIHEKTPIEITTLRLHSTEKKKVPAFKKPKLGKGKSQPFETKKFFYENKSFNLPFYWRDELHLRQRFKGPLVICEYSATTFIPPTFSGKVDGWGNLLIED